VGSLEKRISDLEESRGELARDEGEERDLSARRTITRRIVAEHARLRAAGEGGDLVEKASLAVAHDQYEDLGPENCDYIGCSWAEHMRGWSPLEWGVATGNLGPPPGWG
jgi:hypothetical protein